MRKATAAGHPARVVQLDILRGVAILIVMLYHFIFHRFDAPAIQGPWLKTAHRLGRTGVDLFFVLSGFLIGGLLFKELITRSHLDVRRFIIRRGLKIWPSYFLFLLAVCVFKLAIMRKPIGELRVLWPNLLHVQNYFGSPWAPHTWSLAVQEHFYLVLPVLLVLLIRKQKPPFAVIPGVVAIAVALMVGCAILRSFPTANPTSQNPRFLTHLRADALFLGVFLAYLHHFKPQSLSFAARRPLLLMGLGVALLILDPALLIKNPAVAASAGYSTLALGYGLILLAAIFTPVGQGWLGRLIASPPARGLAFLGLFSYTIYLWHLDALKPIPLLMRASFLGTIPAAILWGGGAVIYLTVACAAGILFGVLLEKPTLALRDRLFPACADAVASVPAGPTQEGYRDGIVLGNSDAPPRPPARDAVKLISYPETP